MTATATPRTDKFEAAYFRNTLSHVDDVFVFAAALEAENAALLALVEEIKGRVQFGVSTHMGSDVVKLCDAALKEGK